MLFRSPHAQMATVFQFASELREVLGADCAAGATAPTQQSVDAAAKKRPASPVVAEHTLKLVQSGAVSLEIKVHEIRWGAPWNQWTVAIPAGSSITLQGGCAGSQQFECRLTDSTVPRQFLPRPFQK